MKKGTMIKVEVEFFEPILGTTPYDPEIYAQWIAGNVAKRKDLTDAEKEEVKRKEIEEAQEALKTLEEKGWTGFMKDEGGEYVYNYWIRGYLKSAFAAQMETGDLNKVKAYKTRIDRFVHVRPRKLHFEHELNGNPLPVIERPLRAMTPKGPRVALARSDALPPGTKLAWTFELLNNNEIKPATLEEAMSFGEYEGMGQWRSGGYGAFVVTNFEVLDA